MQSDKPCPLCLSPEVIEFFEDRWRTYLRCNVCQLTFVPAEFHLSKERERAEYELHENSPNDLGYRKFLSRLRDPLEKTLKSASRGLDFGCGPGPTLSVMLKASGHRIEIYDPFFAPAKSVLEQQYDFVTATEVVEHFRNPAEEFGRIWSLVKPNGVVGIMTKLALDQTAFSKWHYKDDRTHVAFYSRDTFQWLADYYQANLEIIGNDVILLRRNR